MKIGSVTNPKIILFTPYFKQNRGNSTTARRFVKGLKLWGVSVRVFAYEEEEWNSDWDSFFLEADIYHVIHLKRFSQWLKKYPHLHFSKPYILTSGGTDINEDLKDPDAVKLMVSVADESCGITVFSEDGKNKIIQTYPDLADRIYVIPQSVDFPKDGTKESTPDILSGYPKFLLPAGLRPVKDVLYVAGELKRLRYTWPELTFTIIGPVLDEDVYQKVLEFEKGHVWFRYIKEVPLEQMKAIYQSCDFVLNTSISEGQSSAVLEAMALGKPVIARLNSGNASVISDGETGVLFESPEQFNLKVQELLTSEGKQKRMIKNAILYIKEQHSLEKEMGRFLEVYEHCLANAYV
ncbi:glycosyltransferase [Halalkalibacter flavus]|uniref:glycosyltransferase n=1 Tax=Halalkalibacter flavus TaxID=3090668 RepID=UPI002FC99807